jgi:hypothetical protein
MRRWIKQDDIDDGRAEGLRTDERAERARLRRELRVAQIEIEILKRASAYFARENVLPNSLPAGPRTRRRRIAVAGACRVLRVSLRLPRQGRPAAQSSSGRQCDVGGHDRRGSHRLPGGLLSAPQLRPLDRRPGPRPAAARGTGAAVEEAWPLNHRSARSPTVMRPARGLT